MKGTPCFFPAYAPGGPSPLCPSETNLHGVPRKNTLIAKVRYETMFTEARFRPMGTQNFLRRCRPPQQGQLKSLPPIRPAAGAGRSLSLSKFILRSCSHDQFSANFAFRPRILGRRWRMVPRFPCFSAASESFALNKPVCPGHSATLPKKKMLYWKPFLRNSAGSCARFRLSTLEETCFRSGLRHLGAVYLWRWLPDSNETGPEGKPPAAIN